MDNFIYSDDGNLIIGFRLTLFERYSLSEDTIDDLNQILNRAFKDLKAGTMVLKQDIFLSKKNDTSNWSENNYLNSSLKNHFSNYNFTSHVCNIFFINPFRKLKNTVITNPFKKVDIKVFDELDKENDYFIESVKSAISYLSDVKIGSQNLIFEPMTKKETLEYKNLCLSAFSDSYREIKKEWEHLRIGNSFASVIRFSDESGFPDELSTSIIDDEFTTDKSKFFKNYADSFTFNINCDHIYNQFFIVDEASYHIDNARLNNKHINQCRAFNSENKALQKVHNDLIDSIEENKDIERIVRGHNNIILLTNDLNDLEYHKEQVSNNFKKLDIKHIVTSGDNQLAIYLYSNPFFAHLFIENHLFVSTLNVVCSFMNLSTNYRGDKDGVVLCSRIKNAPVKIDLWDERKKFIKARNGIVLAPTGEGKSFLANHIITDYYSKGAKQVIIDLGGSYKKLHYLFPEDSAYISYQEGRSLGINPFALYDNDFEDGKILTQKIEDLAEFVGIHYKREEDINDKERVAFKKIIEIYYKEFATLKEHSFLHFIEFVLDNQNELYENLNLNDDFLDSKRLKLMLSEFVKDGLYSFLYDAKNDSILADLQSKRIVVFELDKIRSNKFLLKVMLQVIATTIRAIIWEDKNTKGLIWFDEVAEQLQWEGMMRRIEWFYQAIRKQEGAINIILQAITQLPTSDIASNIIENTQVLYVLKAKDYTKIKERFNLSNHALYQLNSIKSNFSASRPYSSVWIMRGERHQVYHLEVPVTNFWAYQTDGQENEDLIRIYHDVGSMEKAIELKINQK